MNILKTPVAARPIFVLFTLNILNSFEGNITRRTMNVPQKDTVVILSGGYTVVRLVADNPGWWLFHCHISHHFVVNN